MQISEKQRLGRAKNAILGFLEKRLSVPKVYFDAQWSGMSVPVLAIDRDGVGDVHAVLFLSISRSSYDEQRVRIPSLLSQLHEIPAQYKYVAFVDLGPAEIAFTNPIDAISLESTFASDGLGRLGIFLVPFSSDETPEAKLLVSPERFRAAVTKLADEYVQQHSADWEIRA